MKRLFIAVKIEPGEKLCSLFDELRRKLASERISWVSPHNLHITLKFFGETPEEEIPKIITVMESAVNGITPFDLVIRKTGLFGSRYQPKVIWFGLEQDEPLRQLQTQLTAELKTIGFFPDRQNFVPHLTIARIRNVTDKQSFQKVIAEVRDVDLQHSHIDKLILFESCLTPRGAVYEVLVETGLKDE